MTSTKKTQKTRKHVGKLMTIPQLRSSFEQLDKKAMELRGKDKDDQIKEFQTAWKRIFSRDVSPKAIEAYLAVKHSEPISKRITRRRSRGKQAGGAVSLAGAPLDHQTRPGIDGVSGHFPTYVTSGLVSQQERPQSGGDLLSAILYKPFTSTIPPSILQTTKDMYTGVQPAVSGDPTTSAWAPAK